MQTRLLLSVAIGALASLLTCDAFVQLPNRYLPSGVTAYYEVGNTVLSERKWNFNEGRAPWGLKKNGEIWNGRVAQVAFVWVFLQELITGKGVFKGIAEGDPFNIANAAAFTACVVALTAWLAYQGVDDYTED